MSHILAGCHVDKGLFISRHQRTVAMTRVFDCPTLPYPFRIHFFCLRPVLQHCRQTQEVLKVDEDSDKEASLDLDQSQERKPSFLNRINMKYEQHTWSTP
jgi:hypothetical protein